MPTEPAVYPKTIVLIAASLRTRHEEYRAGGAITPGDLLEINTSNQAIRHATAAGDTPKMFAKETRFAGFGINDDYASGDLVPAHIAQPGDLIYGWVAASATAIPAGAKLKSDGAGGVALTGASTDKIVGRAEAAVDNSANSASRARIKIRVM